MMKNSNGVHYNPNNKKVLFILGAMAIGKSKLFIDFTSHSRAEIVNSDKIQMCLYNIVQVHRERVDQMVEDGLVEEISDIFELKSNYSQGICCAIGVLELEKFFLVKKELNEDVGCDYN
ncbi:hypothetical protein FEM48_Zijuj09G0110700 [Ziziphus jujuba var. spinosa]|uniref:Uncharacterized protein n=1 Tax=Ziziphus jujuba var. spinosa TaxID=714518 RepID=A0A978USM8_ZIZJJ|nr:hypothetical protein FEM48_Zijuj09G0110700 [Ziziphus jujuba var. spinosa]